MQIHRAKHLSRQLVQSHKAQGVLSADKLLEDLEEMINSCKRIARKTEKNEDYFPSLAAMAAWRKTWEFIMKCRDQMRIEEQEKAAAQKEEPDWSLLTFEELQLLKKLTRKAKGKRVHIEIPKNQEEVVSQPNLQTTEEASPTPLF
jgi:hypothetical protein